MPVPSLAPLPGALALPDPSRKGVPLAFGLPREDAALPEPSQAGTGGQGPRLPLPPARGPAAKAEGPASRAAPRSEVRRMHLVFIHRMQPRRRRGITSRAEILWFAAACNISCPPGFSPMVNSDGTTWPQGPLPGWPGLWAMLAGGEPGAGEEELWMARVAAGDEEGLQRLFERWKRPLLGFFYRSLGSHADAEDLALEVFVRLHRSAAGYRPSARFSTYLFQIAQNLLRNELRRRRRKPVDAVPPGLFEEWPQGETGDRRLAELEEVFQQALMRLPEKQRTALLLLHQQQLDYPEAAAVLQVTENALRVIVHRARQALRIEMDKQP